MDNRERNETILQLACDLLAKMNFEVDNAFVEDIEEEEGQVLVEITVANPASLIGFRGKNLAAVQTVLSLMIKSRLGEWLRVLLDVNNYREEQKTRLESMVNNFAEKVLETGKPVALANMSSYERRICHMASVKFEGIMTESEGEGEDRHVVIKKREA